MQNFFNLIVNSLPFGDSALFVTCLGAIFLAIGFVCLVKGSDWFVDGAVGIADRFGIPQIIIGLTIVAMGTSAPEAAVSITGAFGGAADTAIGNIVGSNILNILIILGISSVICPLVVDKSTAFIDTPFMIIITVVLALLGIDGKISLVDGVIFLLLFVGYMAYLFSVALKNKSPEQQTQDKKPLWLTLVLTVGGLGVVILGSQFAVTGATTIAKTAGISESFIGLTIVALGTSLPELFTSVVAAKKGNADIAIGNIVGSNIFNILFVLGISGIVTPIPFASSFLVDTAVAVGAALLLFVCCAKTKKLTRVSGIVMLLSYAAYFGYLLYNL